MLSQRNQKPSCATFTVTNLPNICGPVPRLGKDIRKVRDGFRFFSDTNLKIIKSLRGVSGFFYVLLTVHLSTILVTDHLNAQIFGL